MQPLYPVVPKSALRLLPGEFWSIPLKNGQFACGRVLQSAARYAGASRMFFFGALLNWLGSEPPSSESIAGAVVLAEGKLHIKSISSVGGQVLGHRDLGIDGLSPGYYKHSLGDPHGWLMHGIEPVRPLAAADQALPIGSTWGHGYIKSLAELRLLSRGHAEA